MSCGHISSFEFVDTKWMCGEVLRIVWMQCEYVMGLRMQCPSRGGDSIDDVDAV